MNDSGKTVPNTWKSKVKFDQTNLFEFYNDSLFTIPSYQRDFVWDLELIDNVLDAFRDDYFSGKKSFFGNILTSSTGNNSSSYKEFEIIDGQQRITLIYLIFLAFYEYLYILKMDALKEKGKDKILETDLGLLDERYGQIEKTQSEIKDLLLIYDNKVGNIKISYVNTKLNERFKMGASNLLLSSYKNTSFHKNTRISKAYQSILKYLNDMFDDNKILVKIEKVISFFDFIGLTDIQLITLDDPTLASEIFERINSNSAPLTDWELLKNYIYMQILKQNNDKDSADKFLEEIANKIDEISELKGKNKVFNTIDIIQPLEVLMCKISSSKTAKYKVISRKYADFSDKERTQIIKNSLNDILKANHILTERGSKDVGTILVWSLIDCYDLKQLKKYYIALYAKYGHTENIKYINESFKVLIALTINIVTFKGHVANIVETNLRIIFKNLETNNNFGELKQFIKDTELGKKWNEDNFDFDKFKSIDNSKITFFILYLALYKVGKLMDIAKDDMSEHTINILAMDVEHILPKEPKNWINKKGTDWFAWNGGKDTEELKNNYIENPGNKMILFFKINRGKHVSNNYIDDKLKEYEKSVFFENKSYDVTEIKNIIKPIIKNNQWSKSDIDSRSKDLFNFLKNELIKLYE